MLLQFLGYDISVDTFIENYLECRKFEMRDGQIYGADPNEHFCGSPYSEDDFGCYAPVIKKRWKKPLVNPMPLSMKQGSRWNGC